MKTQKDRDLEAVESVGMEYFGKDRWRFSVFTKNWKEAFLAGIAYGRANPSCDFETLVDETTSLLKQVRPGKDSAGFKPRE